MSELMAPDSQSTTSQLVSVIVVATDEMHHLRDCLPSLAQLTGPPTEVIVIDNASTDGTGAAIAADFSWVRVVRTNQRLGYAPANNLGFRHARGSYMVVLNPDTRVDPHFVRALVETSKRHNDRALVTSRICMFDDPGVINACGNNVQFALLAACRGIGESVANYAAETVVASISGCAFLIPRTVLDLIAPFEESIFPYLEDTELSLRAWIAGLSCVMAPDSLVYHKYSLRLTPRKYFYIERNRWLVMLRTYRTRTLLVLFPALVLIELSAWGYSASLGRRYLRAKARSYVDIGRMMPSAWAGRREMDSLRRVGDRALLERFEAALPVGQLIEDVIAPRGLISLVNAGLSVYFRLVRRVVRW
jgi:GT2 family glycosyltransferase